MVRERGSKRDREKARERGFTPASCLWMFVGHLVRDTYLFMFLKNERRLHQEKIGSAAKRCGSQPPYPNTMLLCIWQLASTAHMPAKIYKDLRAHAVMAHGSCVRVGPDPSTR
eukprot:6213758-Pleurochrysis_carterae.AAC.5